MVPCSRMERRVAIACAVALVLARSVVYAIYPQAHFDSDQAIVGLMAKHLAEGHAFPLFFYGQPYMLAIEAWAAVPWFWIFGATVFALRASLILTNCAIAAMIVSGLVRWGGVRPMFALVASLFFVFAPPLTAARLVEAQGGNVEPFFWVLLLWWLRDRPIWFGATLAVAVLNREFSIYAVPVLVAGQLYRRAFWRRETVRAWALALVAFLFVWQGVEALKPLADLRGPGTRGQLLGGYGGSQVENLADRVSVNPADLPARVRAALATSVPGLIGARHLDEPLAVQGRDWVRWPAALVALAAAIRIAVLLAALRRRPGALGSELEHSAFGWYLAGVGLVAVAAFVITRPVEAASLRYALLGLLLPIGVVAVWLALEPKASVRAAIVACVVLWAWGSAVDNARQLERYHRGEVPDPAGAIARALVDRHIWFAEAPYWRAYKITFLTGERTHVASTDFVRIDRYQLEANAAGASLVRIDEKPCEGGQPVAGWFLCPTASR